MKTLKSIFGLISLAILFLLVLNPKNSSAQRFMIGYGLSVYSDVAIFEVETPDNLDPDSGSDSELAFSILSISAEMKYNIKEFNADLALSAASSPGIGILNYSDYSGFGNVRLPLYVQLDWGNLSTFDSRKNFGIGLGFGVQYDVYNLFGDAGSFSLVSPAARLGVRYFNKNNSAREIALKFGFPNTTTYEQDIEDFNGPTRTVEYDISVTSIQLSWILYFNY